MPKNIYILTFSVRRLAELLEVAGFGIRPGEDIEGGLIQFVSDPNIPEIYIEWSAGLRMPWKRLT